MRGLRVRRVLEGVEKWGGEREGIEASYPSEFGESLGY